MGRTREGSLAASGATASPGRVTTVRRAAVLHRLDEDWAALQEDSAALAACRRWATGAPVLTGCRSPAEVLDRVAQDPDAVLGLLLALVAGGDALAGRVVLQALLPKMVRMASLDRAADVDDYLTALWCEIAAYPLTRRPTSVAANLALDTLKAVRRERHPVADVVSTPDVVLLAADRWPGRVVGASAGPHAPSGLDVGQLIARARAHRLIDPMTGELLRSVYAEGLSGASAADRYGLSPSALRSRCSRAVKVLADHAALLGAG